VSAIVLVTNNIVQLTFACQHPWVPPKSVAKSVAKPTAKSVAKSVAKSAPKPAVSVAMFAPKPAVPLGLRDRKKVETRERLVEVAGALFRKQGYVETSVEQICREAGVSLPTLFRYFPTKADLLFHGADAVVEEWRVAMRAGPKREPLGAALRRATHAIAFKTPERGSVARLRAELSPHDPELRRKALEIDARLIGRIAELMGELLDLNPQEDVRPYLVASCAMAAVRSAQFVVGHGHKSSFPARLEQAFDALDGLSATLKRPVHKA
jgi:AcrR family transcriptional regulator